MTHEVRTRLIAAVREDVQDSSAPGGPMLCDGIILNAAEACEYMGLDTEQTLASIVRVLWLQLSITKSELVKLNTDAASRFVVEKP